MILFWNNTYSNPPSFPSNTMILFWNNTYFYGMLAGNLDAAVFEPLPTYYYVINYTMALIFLASFFVGVGMNPFIIVYNWKKKVQAVPVLFILNAGMICVFYVHVLADLCYG